MGHMKEAVIYDYETFYANPVSCVDLCSQHKPLPEPILIITNYFILDDKDSGQAEEHCIQMVSAHVFRIPFKHLVKARIIANFHIPVGQIVSIREYKTFFLLFSILKMR